MLTLIPIQIPKLQFIQSLKLMQIKIEQQHNEKKNKI